MREEKEILMRMFVNGALSPDELHKLMTALEASETETLSEREGQYPTHQKGTLQESYTSTVMDDIVSSEVGRFMRGDASLIDISLLILFNALFFMGAYLSFLKYDVR